MTEEREKFIAEMLPAIRKDIAEVKKDMVDLALQQCATQHFERGILAHVAWMYSSIDDLRQDMQQVKARLELVGE